MGYRKSLLRMRTSLSPLQQYNICSVKSVRIYLRSIGNTDDPYKKWKWRCLFSIQLGVERGTQLCLVEIANLLPPRDRRIFSNGRAKHTAQGTSGEWLTNGSLSLPSPLFSCQLLAACAVHTAQHTQHEQGVCMYEMRRAQRAGSRAGEREEDRWPQKAAEALRGGTCCSLSGISSTALFLPV